MSNFSYRSPSGASNHPVIRQIRHDLTVYVREQEAEFGSSSRPPDTLAAHLDRVAAHAIALARSEGVDPFSAELAALFHDAGKFYLGRYHEGDVPEEERSIEVLREFADHYGLDATVIEAVESAMRQIYRDDPELSPLAKVLFDADNLDKLGLPGIANYFIKAGLRGQGLTENLTVRMTVELTYARYASRSLYTKSARDLAEIRAAETIGFIHDFLRSLREDGICDLRIEQTAVGDLDLEFITPVKCTCGSEFTKRTWIEKGVKCTEIHLEIACSACDRNHKIRFCRPRLIS